MRSMTFESIVLARILAELNAMKRSVRWCLGRMMHRRAGRGAKLMNRK